MDGGLMVQKILPAEIITQNAAFAVVMFLGTGAMRISTTAPTAGRVWMEVKIVRLVDLDAVIDCIEMEWGYEGIREDLYSLPVVDAVPVVYGRWIRPHWKNNTYCCDCSECGGEAMHRDYQWNKNGVYPICPNCGAKMDGGNDDATS